jgi:hypothetical protein
LVNFCSLFIPDLATIFWAFTKANSRKLTWGEEQKSLFQELKDKMSTAESLAYFD